MDRPAPVNVHPSLEALEDKTCLVMDDDGPFVQRLARALAQRSRGTPRVANRLLRRARDFAEVEGNGQIDDQIVRLTCDRLEIDEAGLDEMDRRLLSILIDHYEGGPVGVETLAAAMAEPRDTIEDVYEPYLLQQGFLGRTPRGRVATKKSYEHLGKPLVDRAPQGKLF